MHWFIKSTQVQIKELAFFENYRLLIHKWSISFMQLTDLSESRKKHYFVSQITESTLRDNNKTTSMFSNDSRANEILFQFLKQSEW